LFLPTKRVWNPSKLVGTKTVPTLRKGWLKSIALSSIYILGLWEVEILGLWEVEILG